MTDALETLARELEEMAAHASQEVLETHGRRGYLLAGYKRDVARFTAAAAACRELADKRAAQQAHNFCHSPVRGVMDGYCNADLEDATDAALAAFMEGR
jgi:hypothetical protein